MVRLLLFFLLTSTYICDSCSLQQDKTNSIEKLEMNLSAFGVEADDFPSIDAYINFVNDSSSCNKSYYHPAFKSSIYSLSRSEIRKVRQLLETTDWGKLKKEYLVGRTDQPTSTIRIYTKKKIFEIKDYGLKGDYPLQKLYDIVYKYDFR